MSDDALADLLFRSVDMTAVPPRKLGSIARYLRLNGVVVLPPAVAEVLRTGELSQEMKIRARNHLRCFVFDKRVDIDGLATGTVRAALAVLMRDT